jgi:hypothetical protein
LTGKNVKADSQEVAEKKYLMMRVGTVLAAAAVLEIVMIQSFKKCYYPAAGFVTYGMI